MHEWQWITEEGEAEGVQFTVKDIDRFKDTVLTLDTGVRTGWALRARGVEHSKSIVAGGFFIIKRESDNPYTQFHYHINGLLTFFQPKIVILEEFFQGGHAVNPYTIELRGAVKLAIELKGVRWVHLHPQTARARISCVRVKDCIRRDVIKDIFDIPLKYQAAPGKREKFLPSDFFDACVLANAMELVTK